MILNIFIYVYTLIQFLSFCSLNQPITGLFKILIGSLSIDQSDFFLLFSHFDSLANCSPSLPLHPLALPLLFTDSALHSIASPLLFADSALHLILSPVVSCSNLYVFQWSLALLHILLSHCTMTFMSFFLLVCECLFQLLSIIVSIAAFLSGFFNLPLILVGGSKP